MSDEATSGEVTSDEATPSASTSPPEGTAQGGQSAPPKNELTCSNCGTRTSGNFCPHCGQPQKERITSAPSLMRDVASNYFTIDARLWRTLRPLLLAPGHLTKEYVQGRRRRYSRPSRVYVAASIVFFFVLSLTNTNVLDNFYTPPDEAAAEVGALVDSTAQQGGYDSPEDSLRATRMQAAMDSLRADGVDVGPGGVHMSDSESGETVNISSEGIQVEDPESGTSINIEAGNFDQDKLLSAFIERLPTLMFVLLPVFALLLKLLYARRSRFYIEHMIFAFHAHAFAFLLFTGSVLSGMLLPAAVADVLEGVLFLGMMAYVFMALRTVYEQSRRKTALKLAILFFSYSIVLTTGFIATIIITVALMNMG